MELRFSPLFSGSSGNSIYVGCDSTHLLVDAGMSGTRITQALHSVGIAPERLNGLLITHEHADHIRGVGVLSRKYDLPIYATEGTWQGMCDKIGEIASKNVCIIDTEQNFSLGDIEIMAFPTPHDANQSCGYLFEQGSAVFALATDIGSVRDSWMKYVIDADAVLLESNYDPDMLQAGPYPYDLKKRILSSRGHLSNDHAARVALNLVNSGTKTILLGHLSKENNFPELALQTTTSLLQSYGVDTDEDVLIRVANRDAPTGIFTVQSTLH